MEEEYFTLQMEKYLKGVGKKAKSMGMDNYRLKIRSSKVFGAMANYNMLTNDLYAYQTIKLLRINNTYNHLRTAILILLIISFKFLIPLIVDRHI